jgi:hypothetical protein
MLILFAFIAFEFKNALKDNQIILNKEKIEITGEYGTEINIKDLKSIELVDKLPEITSKRSGFALETIKKGYFKTINGEEVKLLINSKSNPFILITTKDNQKIDYSSKLKSHEEIYNQLNKIISK